jgi:hypothetical protein
MHSVISKRPVLGREEEGTDIFKRRSYRCREGHALVSERRAEIDSMWGEDDKGLVGKFDGSVGGKLLHIFEDDVSCLEAVVPSLYREEYSFAPLERKLCHKGQRVG